MWPHPLVIIGLLILCTMLSIALLNLFILPRLRLSPAPPTPIRFSVLIPARNEAHQIGQAIASLRSQTGIEFEVLVVDDCSEDGTKAAAQMAIGKDARFQVISGARLPTGWQGKNWACHQLADAARYDHLLFTDADVVWRPGALSAVANQWSGRHIDALTVWPTQETITWGERLVVPLMSFAVLAYLPVWLVNSTNWPYTGAANGQCLCITRRAYRAIGGHAAIQATVLDDVTLAQRLKRQRYWLRMVDGAGLVRCRMYQSWRAVSHGYAKNILAGHGDSPLLLLASTAFHLLLFVAPWLWLFIGSSWAGPGGWPLWPLLLIGVGIAARMVSSYASGQRLADALLMPVSVLLMCWIALRALYQHGRGTTTWKGRPVHHRKLKVEH